MSLERDIDRLLIATRSAHKPRKRPGDGKPRAWRVAHLCAYCEGPVGRRGVGLRLRDEETGVELVAHKRCDREANR